MIFKKVNTRITDCFLGEGWNRWIRINTKSKLILASNVPNPYKYRDAILQNIPAAH